MRRVGLTLCLLASSLGARAESVEDRVATLEARVKMLEQALQAQANQSGSPVAAATVGGAYKALLDDGTILRLDLKDGQAALVAGEKNLSGTYEIVGERVVIVLGNKTEAFTIKGDRLHSIGAKPQMEFVKNK